MPECPLDVTAIVKLAARGDAWVDKLNGSMRRLSPRETLQLRSGELAITAAARLAAHIGATGLVRDVRRWADLSIIPDEPAPTTHDLAEALAIAVRAGLPVEQIEPLLADPGDWLVPRIATALDPERSADLELLQRLAEDPRAEVATAAQERLGSRYAWHWHAGLFESDPQVTYADDPAIASALRDARAALGRERPFAKPGEAQALVAAVQALPPSLAIPLLEEGLRVLPGEGPKALAIPLLEHGGLEAIMDTLRRIALARGNAERALLRAASWCTALPDAVRMELVPRLLPWVEGEDPGGGPTPPPPEPGPRPRDTDLMKGAARLVSALWPPAVAPLPLIDWILRHGHAYNSAFAIVKLGVEAMTPELEPVAETLRDLALAHPTLVRELPELFSHLARTVSEPTLRAITEAFESTEHDVLRTFALVHRTGRLAPSDPAARHALAEAWLDDPRTCKAILGTTVCRSRLLPWLRRRLRAQTLTLDQATTTMSTIGRLHGGVTEPANWALRRRRTELEEAEQRAEARATLGVWTDAPTGPPTSQEWANLRALCLDAIRTTTRPSWDLLAVLPVGPWTPPDLELLDALEQRVLGGDELGAWLVHHFGELLHAKPPADASLRAQRVLEKWADHPIMSARLDGGKLRELAARAPGPSEGPSEGDRGSQPAPAGAPASAPAPDWMDDEEDHEP